MPETSVAMTATTEETLVRRLVRDDDQEDICLAIYRPSTGLSRFSALIRAVVSRPSVEIALSTGMQLLLPTTSSERRKSPSKINAAWFYCTATLGPRDGSR